MPLFRGTCVMLRIANKTMYHYDGTTKRAKSRTSQNGLPDKTYFVQESSGSAPSTTYSICTFHSQSRATATCAMPKCLDLIGDSRRQHAIILVEEIPGGEIRCWQQELAHACGSLAVALYLASHILVPAPLPHPLGFSSKPGSSSI